MEVFPESYFPLHLPSGIPYGLKFFPLTLQDRYRYAAFADAVRRGTAIIRADELTNSIILEKPTPPMPFQLVVSVEADFKHLKEALVPPPGGLKPSFHADGEDFVLTGRG